jgi:hypothetical protein
MLRKTSKMHYLDNSNALSVEMDGTVPVAIYYDFGKGKGGSANLDAIADKAMQWIGFPMDYGDWDDVGDNQVMLQLFPQEENTVASKKAGTPGFEGYLAGTVLKSVANDNSVWIRKESDWNEKIHVGMVHDGSGYTPVSALAVSDRSGDEALQIAYDELEDALRDELEEHRNELYADAIKEGLGEEEAQQRADEWSTESFDGRTWTMTAKELYDALAADRFGKEYVAKLFDIDMEETKTSAKRATDADGNWSPDNAPTIARYVKQYGDMSDFTSYAFDAAQAAYWWLTDNHGGQGSDEYRALSSMDYNPGRSENGPEEDGPAQDMYDAMTSADAIAIVDETKLL